MKPGPTNLITDIQGLKVGNAGDHSLKSGVTALAGERPLIAAVHVMGGAPGTRETDLLAPDKIVGRIDAITLSGGSAFGLDAASGVADALKEDGRGHAVGPVRVPIVPGAILFDLLNGGNKTWPQNPYNALGRQAYEARARSFRLGTAGAGIGATTADVKGGLGSASVELESGLTVGALVAVNPVGSALVDGGPHFWAAPMEFGAEYGGLGPARTHRPMTPPATKLTLRQGENTTIAIVATNATLTTAEATRLSTAAHDGMARALYPSHTPYDGDLVFAVSTGEKPLADPVLDPLILGHAAALCLARAIARGIFEATEEPGDTLPTWQQEFAS